MSVHISDRVEALTSSTYKHPTFPTYPTHSIHLLSLLLQQSKSRTQTNSKSDFRIRKSHIQPIIQTARRVLRILTTQTISTSDFRIPNSLLPTTERQTKNKLYKMISMGCTPRSVYTNTVEGILVFSILAAAIFGLWALVSFLQMLLRISLGM